jgi:F-type H+-transporting ATPase subunit c
MEGLSYFGAAIATGLAVIGTAYGIGRIGSAAMEGTARQPEMAGDIRVSMLIASVFIEGVCLFAEVICLLVVLLK